MGSEGCCVCVPDHWDGNSYRSLEFQGMECGLCGTWLTQEMLGHPLWCLPSFLAEIDYLGHVGAFCQLGMGQFQSWNLSLHLSPLLELIMEGDRGSGLGLELHPVLLLAVKVKHLHASGAEQLWAAPRPSSSQAPLPQPLCHKFPAWCLLASLSPRGQRGAQPQP